MFFWVCSCFLSCSIVLGRLALSFTFLFVERRILSGNSRRTLGVGSGGFRFFFLVCFSSRFTGGDR